MTGCTHATSIVLESFPGFSVLQCTWECQEYLIEVEVGNSTVVTIPVSKLPAMIEVIEAAGENVGSCNRRLERALKELKAKGKVTA